MLGGLSLSRSHRIQPLQLAAALGRHRHMCEARAVRCAANAHIEKQRQIFDGKADFFSQPQPDDVQEKLKRIVAATEIPPPARVIDVGSGTGCLIPHLQAAGVDDILAVDVSPKMLEALSSKYGVDSTLGNEAAVRTWLGDICELPAHQGRAQAVFMNAVFGNLQDPKAALLHCCGLLTPGGSVTISHPLGREWHKGLHESDTTMVPHELPDERQLQELTFDLPFQVERVIDESDFYAAVLRIPPGYALPGGVLQLEGPVVEGFQRGSKEMGVPTANVAPLSVEEQLKDLPKGVYFGLAQVQDTDGEGDGSVYKMVMNYGVRPTIKDGSNVTVEAHIMHKYAADFYGKPLKLAVMGFLRPEMAFSSLDDLVARIHADIGTASAQLDGPEASEVRESSWWT